MGTARERGGMLEQWERRAFAHPTKCAASTGCSSRSITSTRASRTTPSDPADPSVTKRVISYLTPYPICFYAKTMDGRIDDPNGG